jgi:hypothetical protein
MFLEITFHDNDSMNPVNKALRRLYEYIDSESKDYDGTITESIFKNLHEHNALLPMIQRLYVIELLANDIEYLTRGLSSKNIDYSEFIIRNPNKVSYENKYLKFDLKFHKDGQFMMRDENREKSSLNLWTGEVVSF